MSGPSREPIACFLTWTTYGSWLPGDGRGWTDASGVVREPNPRLVRQAAASLRASALAFNNVHRMIVERAIAERAHYAGWLLHAAHCRVTHVHAVISAPGLDAARVLGQLKAWSTRALRDQRTTAGAPWRPIWTKGGSARWLFDDAALMAAVHYVRECQDPGRVSQTR